MKESGGKQGGLEWNKKIGEGRSEKSGADRENSRARREKHSQKFELYWSGSEWSGAGWGGAERSGVEWSEQLRISRLEIGEKIRADKSESKRR